MPLIVGDAKVVEWVRQRMPLPIDDFGKCSSLGIVDREGNPLAGVVYNNFVGVNIELSIASVSPRWATRGHIQGILSYPFHQLGCRRVTAVTARENNHVREFLKRLGFMHEGTLHDALPHGDAVIYGMTKRFFLRSKWNGIGHR